MRAMTKITMSAGALINTTPALEDLSANRLPIGISVKVGRMRRVVAEFHVALMEHVVPLIAKHTDGGDSIGPDHKNHAAFTVDAKPHFEEEIELEVETVALSALESTPDVSIEPNHIAVLLELGFITSEGE